MPTNAMKLVRGSFKPLPDAQERRRSAIRIAEAIIAAPSIMPVHRRELLSIAIWKYTEADAGKWGIRYRSEEVVHGPVASIQHEHVIPRKQLVDQMLENPGRTAEILAMAQACLVTVAEHARLTAVPDGTAGWERYRAAEVVVLDMAAQELQMNGAE